MPDDFARQRSRERERVPIADGPLPLRARSGDLDGDLPAARAAAHVPGRVAVVALLESPPLPRARFRIGQRVGAAGGVGSGSQRLGERRGIHQLPQRRCRVVQRVLRVVVSTVGPARERALLRLPQSFPGGQMIGAQEENLDSPTRLALLVFRRGVGAALAIDERGPEGRGTDRELVRPFVELDDADAPEPVRPRDQQIRPGGEQRHRVSVGGDPQGAVPLAGMKAQQHAGLGGRRYRACHQQADEERARQPDSGPRQANAVAGAQEPSPPISEILPAKERAVHCARRQSGVGGGQ